MAFSEATVEASADFTKFDQEFPTKLREAVTKSTQKVVPNFRTAGTEAGNAFINGVVNAFNRVTGAARRSGAEAGRAFANAAEAFTSNIDVGFKQATLSGSRLGEEFRRAAEQFTQAIPVSFAPRPAARIQGQVAGARYRAGAQEFVNPIPVTFDTRNATALGDKAGRAFRAAVEAQTRGTRLLPGGGGVPRLPTPRAGGAGAGDSGGFLSFLGGLPLLFKVILAALPVLTPLLASATVNAFGFVGSLLPLGGILAALPGAISLFAGSLVLIAVAGKSIGETFKRDLTPAFETLQKQVGAVAVRGLDAQLNQFGKTLLGPVSQGLRDAAVGLNALLVNTIAFFNTAATGKAIVAVFDSIGLTFSRLAVSVPVLFGGLRDVTVSTIPIFNRLSILLEQVITRFGRFLSTAAASGRAFDWVDKAIDLVAALGATAFNLGSILNSIFKAAAGVTGDLVASLAQATGQFAAFLKSAEGAQLLTTIFQTLQVIAAPLHLTMVALGQAIGPLSQILGIILGVIGQLGPVVGQLVSGLAQGLLPIVEALQPVLAGLVQGLTDFLAPLAPILAQLGAAIGAALLPLSQFLGEFFRQLGPQLGVLVTTLGNALLPIFVALAPVVQQLVAELTPLIPDIVALIPPIVELVVALTPLIVLLTQFGVQTLTALVPLIRFGVQLQSAFNIGFLIPVLQGIAQVLTFILTPLKSLIHPIDQVSGGISKLNIAKAIGDALRSFGDAVVNAFNVLNKFGEDVRDFFFSLPGRVVDALKALPGQLADAFSAAVSFVFESIGRQIGLIITLFTDVGPRIIEGLLRLRTDLQNFFVQLLLDAGTQISIGWDNIIAFIDSIPDRFVAALNALPVLLGNIFTDVKNTVTGLVSGAADAIVQFWHDIPGRLSAFGGALLNTGKQLINNFLTGLSGFGEKASDFIASIGRGLKRWVNDNIIGALERGLNDTLPFHVSLPRLAKGAFLTQPTLALLAEAGPEVAIPLSDPARARQLAQESGLTNIINAGGGGVTNVRVFIGERELADMVRVETDNAMTRQGEALLHGPRWVGA